MKRPKVILLAGTPGSGKSQLASYLSYTFGLPIFSNNAIRNEIKMEAQREKTKPKIDDYLKLQSSRLEGLIKTKKSFIYDASIDRSWPQLSKRLKGYDVFIISFDYSSAMLIEHSKIKRPQDTTEIVEKRLREHREFAKRYNKKINLSITEEDFSNRLTIAHSRLEKFLMQ